MKNYHFLLFAAALILRAVPAFASGLLVPGGPIIEDGSLQVAADTSFPPDPSTFELQVAVNLEPNRSYACTILGLPNQVAEADLDFHSVTDPSFAPMNAFTIGDVTPGLVGDAGDTANNRVALLPSGTGTQTAGMYTLRFANQSTDIGGTMSLATRARVDCVETTLYGGYNTNVNDFNFLEILNITNAPIAGAITATNADGTVVINKQAFSVQPNRRADIDIHTAAGANKFGLIQIVHTGPYGALQAYVSQYDGNISNFVLTSTSQLRPRAK